MGMLYGMLYKSVTPDNGVLAALLAPPPLLLLPRSCSCRS
jgi:hypothetical protein